MVLLIFLFIVLTVIFYCLKKKRKKGHLGIAMSAGASELLGFTLLIPFLSLKTWLFLILFTFLVCEGGRQINTELMI